MSYWIVASSRRSEIGWQLAHWLVSRGSPLLLRTPRFVHDPLDNLLTRESSKHKWNFIETEEDKYSEPSSLNSSTIPKVPNSLLSPTSLRLPSPASDPSLFKTRCDHNRPFIVTSISKLQKTCWIITQNRGQDRELPQPERLFENRSSEGLL